jgi:hypothetical protein
MTHEELRKRAVKWLTGKGCSVVLSEIVALDGHITEIPDAIGWKHGNQSTLVECKISRSDFKANAEKLHMQADSGVGQYRYFLTPPNMMHLDEVPEGWGLLETRDKHIHVKKDAAMREPNRAYETSMLVSALRRIKAREFIILVPDAAQEQQLGAIA